MPQKKKTKPVWSKNDRKGPADKAENLKVPKRAITLNLNEQGFRLNATVVEYSSDIRQSLWVITHEIYEAATDPDVSNGYFDHAKGGETEVGHLCNGQTMMMDGYTIQMVWSQGSCGCK